jgi:5'(3')-deoxyribonucleotidase
MTTIYLDMDGVVADFDEYAERILGPLPGHNGIYPDDKWQKIAANPRLYRDLKKTHYADQLVEECKDFAATKEYALLFLTAVPKGNDIKWAFYDKLIWAQNYFPGIAVHFGPYSVDKWHHCRPGDILIDDRPSNIDEWRAAGGIAIHHTAINSTLFELSKLY